MTLVSHDGSVERLARDGHDVADRGGFLFVRVPYLNGRLEYCEGYLADAINLASPGVIGPAQSHQLHFVGEQPYNLDGSPMVQLGGGVAQAMLNGVTASFHFSMKLGDAGNPGQLRNYVDLYEKVTTYANMIGGPALARYPEARLGQASASIGDTAVESPFVYFDAMSSHAGITELNKLFSEHSIAIVGAGGTGGYVLDFLAKTPVRAIKIIDDDAFYIKNSYRWPGVPDDGEFMRPKAEILAERYKRFHKGVAAITTRVTEDSASLLDGITFAFVCVDKGASRVAIAALLRRLDIPFIDTGMGFDIASGRVNGMLRTTFVDGTTAPKIAAESCLPSMDVDDLYRTNIQISELNALNAALAVMRFKQHVGFYGDDRSYYHMLFAPQRSVMHLQTLQDGTE
jgi:hypothetical protein